MLTEEDLVRAERLATDQLKVIDDFSVACTLYSMILSSLAKGHSPESICKGLEATVRAIRTASSEKQLAEITVPGVQ